MAVKKGFFESKRVWIPVWVVYAVDLYMIIFGGSYGFGYAIINNFDWIVKLMWILLGIYTVVAGIKLIKLKHYKKRVLGLVMAFLLLYPFNWTIAYAQIYFSDGWFNSVKSKFVTSQEMKNLRRIETSLNLPQADERSEEDKGCYHDWMSSPQYDIHIYIRYRDFDKISQAMQDLENSGWKISSYHESQYRDLHTWSYWYLNEAEEMTRVFISTESGTTNTFKYSMIISDENEDQCRR